MLTGWDLKAVLLWACFRRRCRLVFGGRRELYTGIMFLCVAVVVLRWLFRLIGSCIEIIGSSVFSM